MEPFYENLLKKYMQLIWDQETITYVEFASKMEFTKLELEELSRIEESILNRGLNECVDIL